MVNQMSSIAAAYAASLDAAFAKLVGTERSWTDGLVATLKNLVQIGEHIVAVDALPINQIEISPRHEVVTSQCHPPPPASQSIDEALKAVLQWHEGVLNGQPTRLEIGIDIQRCIVIKAPQLARRYVPQPNPARAAAATPQAGLQRPLQFGDTAYWAMVAAAMAPLGADEEVCAQDLTDALQNMATAGARVLRVEPEANRIVIVADPDNNPDDPAPNESIDRAIRALNLVRTGVAGGVPPEIVVAS